MIRLLILLFVSQLIISCDKASTTPATPVAATGQPVTPNDGGGVGNGGGDADVTYTENNSNNNENSFADIDFTYSDNSEYIRRQNINNNFSFYWNRLPPDLADVDLRAFETPKLLFSRLHNHGPESYYYAYIQAKGSLLEISVQRLNKAPQFLTNNDLRFIKSNKKIVFTNNSSTLDEVKDSLTFFWTHQNIQPAIVVEDTYNIGSRGNYTTAKLNTKEARFILRGPTIVLRFQNFIKLSNSTLLIRGVIDDEITQNQDDSYTPDYKALEYDIQFQFNLKNNTEEYGDISDFLAQE